MDPILFSKELRTILDKDPLPLSPELIGFWIKEFIDCGITRSRVEGITSTYFHPQITQGRDVPNESSFKKPEICFEYGDTVERGGKVYKIEKVSVGGAECTVMDVRLHTIHNFIAHNISLVKKLDYAAMLYRQLLKDSQATDKHVTSSSL
jgi:hypothetical protein